MSWRPARSIMTILAEINAAAPGRSKTSDGTIGDTAHSSRTSDHNPNAAGVVRAVDITHDPDGGPDARLDCNLLAARLAGMLASGHPALGSGAYIIWRSRIISRDRLGEGWRAYSGSNPHDKHLHLSVATSSAGYDSTAPWGVMEAVVPGPTPEELRRARKDRRLRRLLTRVAKTAKEFRPGLRKAAQRRRNRLPKKKG